MSQEDPSQTEGAAELPRLFGEYHLLAPLGRGGMADIYLAKRIGFRSDIQRYCVVKMLRPERGSDAGFVARFYDEARVVVTLNHRNICHVFDVGRVDDAHYLAMELIEGVSLGALQKVMETRAEQLASDVALHLIDEVLEALDYAHRHKSPTNGEPLHIVHRDVSPQNVMVSFEGEVKLIDFGLVDSTLKREHTAADMVVGKLLYMSPEQSRGEPVDARTDVYSAAIVLYELLLGRRFWAGVPKGRVMVDITEGTYVPAGLDELPADLAAVLRRALAPEPAARTASCADLQSELRDVATRAGWRATTRDVREAVARLVPQARGELEEALIRFRDVGVDVDVVRAVDEKTQVIHIATSSLEGTLSAEASTSPFHAPAQSGTRSAVEGVAPAAVAWRWVPAALAGAVLFVSAVVVWSGAYADGKPSVSPTLVQDVARPEGSPVDHALPAEERARAVPDDGGTSSVTSSEDAGARTALVTPPVDDRKPAARQRRRAHATTASRRPPDARLRDLGDHFAYLERHCRKRAPTCSRRVLGERRRVPVLSAPALAALLREAERCVATCRR